jgi:hypothetical protein
MANTQLPYQLYKPLISVYSTWVDIQLNLQTLSRDLITPKSSSGATDDPTSLLTKRSPLSTPAPLRALCPACFGPDPLPRFVVVCFDGNMQQKRTGVARNDSRDVTKLGALFVENSFQSKDEIIVFEAWSLFSDLICRKTKKRN